MHEGWLDVILTFAKHDCNLLISCCEQSTAEQLKEAAADPEQLLSHIRTCGTVHRLQVLPCAGVMKKKNCDASLTFGLQASVQVSSLALVRFCMQ
jgi:hypothetical protein